MSTAKLLSLTGERLTPKVLDHYLHRDLVMLPLLWHSFAHFILLILEYLDHHQNLISSLLYYGSVQQWTVEPNDMHYCAVV